MKRIYISGPMTGLPGQNMAAFDAEALRLRGLGFEAENPAEINAWAEDGWHACMRRDLAALLTCDTLALLEGWQRSAGAHLEMHIAHRVGIEIVLVGEIGPCQ